MTAVVHHGYSGSFKSFAIVQRVIIPALIGTPVLDADGKKTVDDQGNTILSGRTVVTNIRGLNSVEQIETALDVVVHPDSKIIYIDPDGGTRSWQMMRVWFHWAPLGSLIALDETAKIYSIKRTKDFKEFDLPLFTLTGDRNPEELIKSKCQYWDGNFERPEDLETAVDMHRHYHWDLYYSCTNITKLHKELRDNLEGAYRHKSLGSLLPWKKNSWKEFHHDSADAGKSLSNYLTAPKTYTADLRVFGCYLSTKDGKAKLSPENNSILRNPKFLAVCASVLVALFYIASSANTLLSDSSEPIKIDKVDSEISITNDSEILVSDINNGNSGLSNTPRAASTSLKTPLLVQDVLSLPMGYKLSDNDRFTHYLNGDFKIYVPLFIRTASGFYATINVEQHNKIIDIFSSKDLDYFGYDLQPISGGFRISRANVEFYISRDSPSDHINEPIPQDIVNTTPIVKNGFFQ